MKLKLAALISLTIFGITNLYAYEITHSGITNTKLLGDRDNGYFPAPILTSREQADYLILYNNLLASRFMIEINSDVPEFTKNLTRCSRNIELRSWIDLINKNPKYFNKSDIIFIEDEINKRKKIMGMSCVEASKKNEEGLEKMRLRIKKP